MAAAAILRNRKITVFSPLRKPADRARPIYFTFRNFFLFYFEQSYLRIYCTNLYDFSPKEGICVNVVNPVQFFRFLRDVAMAANFVAKLWQNYLPPALIALVLQKRMEYCYLNERINSINDASISCENFAKFGPVTAELTELICKCQVRHSQKLVHLVEYLWMYRTDFCNLFTI